MDESLEVGATDILRQHLQPLGLADGTSQDLPLGGEGAGILVAVFGQDLLIALHHPGDRVGDIGGAVDHLLLAAPIIPEGGQGGGRLCKGILHEAEQIRGADDLMLRYAPGDLPQQLRARGVEWFSGVAFRRLQAVEDLAGTVVDDTAIFLQHRKSDEQFFGGERVGCGHVKLSSSVKAVSEKRCNYTVVKHHNPDSSFIHIAPIGTIYGRITTSSGTHGDTPLNRRLIPAGSPPPTRPDKTGP